MSRIVKVAMARYDYAVTGEFKFLKPGPDGKARRPSVIVRLEDDAGHVGYGQAVPLPSWGYESPETVEVTLRHHLAPALLGLDPAHLAAVHDRMNAVVRPGFSVGQPMLKAAIDLACYDLAGKRDGRSVRELLGGGGRDRITLSWTISASDMDAVERQLAEGWAKGYRHFNIKVGAPQTPAFDLELARTVRRLAPSAFLWADANTGYTLEEALVMARKLADLGVNVLESPLPPAQLQGYRELKKLGALPIIMDEGILSPVEAREFALLGMMDGIAMKPARNAGLWPSKTIVETLKELGLMVLGSGLTDPDLSLAAAVQLYGWADVSYPCAVNGPQFLAESLLTPATRLIPEGGELAVPSGPGLGVVLDADRLPFETLAEA